MLCRNTQMQRPHHQAVTRPSPMSAGRTRTRRRRVFASYVHNVCWWMTVRRVTPNGYNRRRRMSGRTAVAVAVYCDKHFWKLFAFFKKLF